MSQENEKAYSNDGSENIKVKLIDFFFSNSCNVWSFLAEKRGNDRRSQICMYNEQQLVIFHPLYVPHLR